MWLVLLVSGARRRTHHHSIFGLPGVGVPRQRRERQPRRQRWWHAVSIPGAARSRTATQHDHRRQRRERTRPARVASAGGAGTTNMTNSILYGNVGEDCSGFTYETVTPTASSAPTSRDASPSRRRGPRWPSPGCSCRPWRPHDGAAPPSVRRRPQHPPLPDAAHGPVIDDVARASATAPDSLARSVPARDLGAFELTLGCDSVDDRSTGPSVRPRTAVLQNGAEHVPIDQIPWLRCRPGRQRSGPSRSHPAAQLRGIDLEQTGLAAVPLRSVALRSIALDTEVLDSISLDQLPLDYTSATNGAGWAGYLLDHGLADLAEQPLNTVTLGQVLAETDGDGIELSQIDFSATPLGSLPVGAIAMGTATLAELELPAGTDWCTLIETYTERSCGSGAGDIDLGTATLVSISLQGVPLRQVPLRSGPVAVDRLRGVALAVDPVAPGAVAAGRHRGVAVAAGAVAPGGHRRLAVAARCRCGRSTSRARRCARCRCVRWTSRASPLRPGSVAPGQHPGFAVAAGAVAARSATWRPRRLLAVRRLRQPDADAR